MVAKHIYYIEWLHRKILGYVLGCLVGIGPADCRVPKDNYRVVLVKFPEFRELLV